MNSESYGPNNWVVSGGVHRSISYLYIVANEFSTVKRTEVVDGALDIIWRQNRSQLLKRRQVQKIGYLGKHSADGILSCRFLGDLCHTAPQATATRDTIHLVLH